MDTYYYDGMLYESVDNVMRAVRRDVDLCFGDADLDLFIRESGGVYFEGCQCNNCASLKRHSFKEYREKRNEAIEWVVSEVRDALETGLVPIRVPFTCNILDCEE